MSRAGDAYTALTEEIQHTPTPCREDPRFILDELPKAECDRMAAICDNCPVLALCDTYAAVSRPLAGFWAGHRASYYRTSNRRSNPNE